MIVDVSTVLNCSADKAWDEVQKSSLHRHIIRPLARVVSSGPPIPERWTERLTIRCKLFVFGIIPFGIHTIYFAKINHGNYHIQTHEHNAVISRWNHLVSIKPVNGSRSIYRDTIDIDAGSLTFVIWAWANWFYRHRQWRWRALAKKVVTTDGYQLRQQNASDGAD
jgi:hypothetical protein